MPMTVYKNRLGFRNVAMRAVWNLTWLTLYRPSPNFMHAWRRCLLRLFGAKIGRRARPYPKCQIWAPWNLEMKEYSCIANEVDCYNVAKVSLGAYSLISQYSHICAATHDYQDPEFTLVAKPIVIADKAWVAAGAFIGPGVTVGEGAVVGARSCVTKDIPEWTVVTGNPPYAIRKRVIRSPSTVALADATSGAEAKA